MSQRLYALRLGLYVFFSGGSALVYQTVWQRELRLIFGGSTAASGAVLAAFIGGLGAGSLFLSPRVERSPRPFRLYAAFEGLIALSAAATPLLFSWVRSIYVALGGTLALGAVGGSALRVVLTALAVLVPTFLMGGTLPALARAATSAQDSQRSGVALLYGLNTLGAVAGAALGTFALLPMFGNRATLWAGCALNALVALVAFLHSRRLPEAATAPEVAASPEPAAAPGISKAVVLGAAFLAGAVFFLMELVWFRMLAPLLGGTVYTFGLVLCVALAGIGLGGAAYGALARRGIASMGAFALVCLLEALAIAIPYALGDRLAFLAQLTRPLVVQGPWGSALAWLTVTVPVVFPAAFVSGVQFPLLIALAGRAHEKVAVHVAQVYAANTAGSVLGALAGGFGLLPALSAPGAWRLAAASLVVMGLLALVAQGLPRLGPALQGLLVAGLTVGCLFAQGPTPVWRHHGIGQGRSDHQGLFDINELERGERILRRSFLWEKDGVEAAVGLKNQDSMAFMVNGKSDGNATLDAATQVMSGLLGTMLHPAPRRVLVIGLGSGSTAGWLAQLPEVERVDVYELEPVILEVARTMAVANQHVLDNPKVHIEVGDARELLALNKDQYDVLFSEPSNPFRVGVANLFTQEYYRQVADHLKPGGIFVQWMQAYEVDGATVTTVYQTLRSVFGSVETWFGTPTDLLLVSTAQPLQHDVATLAARAATEPYASALTVAWFTQSAEGVMARFLAGGEFTESLLASTHPGVNTDDFNRIEFGVARTVGAGRNLAEELRAMAEAFNEASPPALAGLDADVLRFERWFALHGLRTEPPHEVPDGWTADERSVGRASLALVDGLPEEAAEAWPAAAVPRTPFQRLVHLAALATRKSPEVAAEASALRKTFPIDVAVLEALAARQLGDTDAEVGHLERAFSLYRESPWVQSKLLERALLAAGEQRPSADQLTRLAAAVSQRFAVGELNETRLDTRLRLANLLGDDETCAQIYEQMLPNLPWSPTHLVQCFDCFKARRPQLLPQVREQIAKLKRMSPKTIRALQPQDRSSLGR